MFHVKHPKGSDDVRLFLMLIIPPSCIALVVVMAAVALPGRPTDLRVALGLLAFAVTSIGSAWLLVRRISRRDGST